MMYTIEYSKEADKTLRADRIRIMKNLYNAPSEIRSEFTKWSVGRK